MDARPLYERYRPQTFDEVVGQDKAIDRLKAIRAKTGLAGRAYWVSGLSGTGKSTIARVIALEVAGKELFVTELDAQSVTPAFLADIERESRLKPLSSLGAKGTAYIVNEAHGLRRDAVKQLLVLLEPPRLKPHVAFIFTTTCDNQESFVEAQEDASPLLSRCLRFDLAKRDLAKAFAERALAIARAEGMDGRPLADYIRLVQKHRQNLRSVLQEIESGAMLTNPV